ncbi:hypothetical protein B0H12DRAFT_1096266 [Mycena haematopus]|nr:hypothetical protein B0H12DRAFT_1096266 [Mycena haematopus]
MGYLDPEISKSPAIQLQACNQTASRSWRGCILSNFYDSDEGVLRWNTVSLSSRSLFLSGSLFMDSTTHSLRRGAVLTSAAAGPALEPILIFDILTVVAFVILLLSVLVAWFSGVQRVKTWYLLQLTSAGYCLSFLLLVGRQTGPEPPLQFCALSASLIYAAPPAVASAALFFVIELHLRLSSAIFSRSMSDTFIYWVAWGIPISHGVVFWVSLIVRTSEPRHLHLLLAEQNRLACPMSPEYNAIQAAYIVISWTTKCRAFYTALGSMNFNVTGRGLLTGSLVILFLGAMLLMEAFTIVHLVQQRAAVRNAVRVRKSDFPLPLFIRTVLFSISGGFGIIMADILLNVSSAVTVILLAIIPLSVALVFGTQKELLRAVFLCRFSRNKEGAVPLSATSSV